MCNLLTKVNIHKIPTAVGKEPFYKWEKRFSGGGGSKLEQKENEALLFFIYIQAVPLYLLTRQ